MFENFAPGRHAVWHNLLDEIACTDIDPALLAQVQALFAHQQARLAEDDFKIKAVTFELT